MVSPGSLRPHTCQAPALCARCRPEHLPLMRQVQLGTRRRVSSRSQPEGAGAGAPPLSAHDPMLSGSALGTLPQTQGPHPGPPPPARAVLGSKLWATPDAPAGRAWMRFGVAALRPWVVSGWNPQPLLCAARVLPQTRPAALGGGRDGDLEQTGSEMTVGNRAPAPSPHSRLAGEAGPQWNVLPCCKPAPWTCSLAS